MSTWWDNADPLVVRFLDTVEVAGATSRASLSPVLLELRQVFREFERLDYPDCAAPIRDELVAGMQDTADGFNDFLAEDDYLSTVRLDRAALHFWTASNYLIQYFIVSDVRLVTIALDWGGYIPNAETATWVHLPNNDQEMTLTSVAAAATATYAREAVEAGLTQTVQATIVAPTQTAIVLARNRQSTESAISAATSTERASQAEATRRADQATATMAFVRTNLARNLSQIDAYVRDVIVTFEGNERALIQAYIIKMADGATVEAVAARLHTEARRNLGLFPSTIIIDVYLVDVLVQNDRGAFFREFTYNDEPPPTLPPVQACGATELAAAMDFATAIQSTLTQISTTISPRGIQVIRDTIAALAYPPCVATARQYLLNALDESYLALTSSNPTVMQSHMDNATTQMNFMDAELQRIVPGGGGQ